MSAPAITVETRTEALRRIIATPTLGREMSVWADASDEEPRIRDTDLASWLGYAEPRMVRKLIKRMWPGNKGPHVRSTVERTSMPKGGAREVTVLVYWLTEAEALKVIARSETPIADAVLDEIIAVYMAVRRHLVTTVPVKAHERQMPAAPQALAPAQRFVPPPPPAPKPQLVAPASKPEARYIIELHGTSTRVLQVIAEYTPREPVAISADRALVDLILNSLGVGR